MKKKYDERKKALKQKKLEMVLKKQNDLKEKEMKADQKKLEAVNKLVTLGIRAWLSADEAIENLETIDDESEKRSAILAQLAFYKYVINLKCPANLYAKTKVSPESNTRVDRDSNELQDSLLQVLELNRMSADTTRPTSSMKPRKKRDQAFEKGKTALTKSMNPWMHE